MATLVALGERMYVFKSAYWIGHRYRLENESQEPRQYSRKWGFCPDRQTQNLSGLLDY